MNLSGFSIKRPLTILMLTLGVLLFGMVSLTKLSVDLFPEIDVPVAVTITTYEGVGPEEIEELITKPIEAQLSTMEGLDTISSTSSQGTSMVITEFAYGTDMDQTLNDMREKLERIKARLPDDAGDPQALTMDPNSMPIIRLGVTGNKSLAKIKEIVENEIEPALEKIPGVASVDISGGKTREIQVEVDPHLLQTYNLSMGDIKNAIAAENRDASAGYVQEGVKDYLIKAKGQFASLDELGNILISLKNGGNIQLKYIAEIKDTYEEVEGYSLLNGQESIGVSITKQSDANTVEVADGVNEALAELKGTLPQGINIEVANDQSSFIKKAINSVYQNALRGAVIAVLVLLLFLRNIRATLIIGTAIPISMISTFILMNFGGLTLNMITLGGLSLGIGMMVDSSIVILENIFRFRQEGYGVLEAAQKGAAEVGAAITASTLTTIAVFLPVVFVEGITAQIFKPMALTVVFALTASMLVALTLIPMLSSKLLVIDKGDGKGLLYKISKAWDDIFNKLDNIYMAILKWALNWRKTVVIFTIVLLFLSFFSISLIGMEFMPQSDSGEMSISIKLPNNTVLSETEKVVFELEEILADIPEVTNIFTTVGGSGRSGRLSSGGKSTNQASINVKLLSVTERERGVKEIVEEVRSRTAKIPNADITVSADRRSAGGAANPISISIKGDDLATLETIADSFVEKINNVPGTREVTTSLSDGIPEINVVLDRKKATEYGISFSQALENIGAGMDGVQASQFREGGEEYNIKVVFPKESRTNLEDLKGLKIQNSQGIYIPVEEIATFEYTQGPTTVERENQSRLVTITGNIIGRDIGSVTRDIKAAVQDVIIPVGYEVEYGGSNRDMNESFYNLGLALIMSILLVYMVMVCQFESLMDPFMIMFSVPPTFIGIMAGLLVTGTSLSVPAFIGIIMLAGIVVNNAIVLVDYTNTLRAQGIPKLDALLKAGPTRLRPILMTTLTTVLALLPQAMGIGEGTETMAPMATVVVFGLSFSTLVTLVLIPVVYYSLDEIREKLSKGKNRTVEI